ncbi:MAG: TNT domain-containing protein, partial [Haloechinothrix sp.]
PQTSAPAPPSQPAVGTPRQDRQTVVAFFLVHMFPIGHLPVAANKPARQLPPPPAEADVAAGLRFPPHDHPDSATIDSLLQPDTTAGQHEGLPAEHPTVAVLSEDYDPLGGLHERDWDRRYLVKPDECSPEFAWPPCEVYPEGGYEEGEPVVLDAGAVLDRFGDPAGRVFGEDATPVRKRALPPAHLDAGYRRYRVLRALPMWRAVSAGWFGQPGGGPRYRAVYSAGELVSMGYLADITCDDSTGNDSTGNDSTGESA